MDEIFLESKGNLVLLGREGKENAVGMTYDFLAGTFGLACGPGASFALENPLLTATGRSVGEENRAQLHAILDRVLDDACQRTRGLPGGN